MINKKLCIITTLASQNEGLGHVSRAMLFYSILSSLNENVLLILETTPNLKTPPQLKKMNHIIVHNSLEEEEILHKNKDLCKLLLIDKRDTDNQFYKNNKAITLGIDNMGIDKSFLDITYSPLPHFNPILSNIEGSQYLLRDRGIDKARHSSKADISTILITFGGSDPYDITLTVLKVMSLINYNASIKIITGLLYNGGFNEEIHSSLLKNLKISWQKDLSKNDFYRELNKADIVFTAFGLTTFESLMLKKPTFLINHTSYHNQLSESCSLPHASITGQEMAGAFSLNQLIKEIKLFLDNPRFIDIPLPNKDNEPFLSILKSILNLEKQKCPYCINSEFHPVVKRSLYSTTYSCDGKEFFLKW